MADLSWSARVLAGVPVRRARWPATPRPASRRMLDGSAPPALRRRRGRSRRSGTPSPSRDASTNPGDRRSAAASGSQAERRTGLSRRRVPRCAGRQCEACRCRCQRLNATIPAVASVCSHSRHTSGQGRDGRRVRQPLAAAPSPSARYRPSLLPMPAHSRWNAPTPSPKSPPVSASAAAARSSLYGRGHDHLLILGHGACRRPHFVRRDDRNGNAICMRRRFATRATRQSVQVDRRRNVRSRP